MTPRDFRLQISNTSQLANGVNDVVAPPSAPGSTRHHLYPRFTALSTQLVKNCVIFKPFDKGQTPRRFLRRFFNCWTNLVGFSSRKSDDTSTVPDDHHRGKVHQSAPFGYFTRPIHVDDFLLQRFHQSFSLLILFVFDVFGKHTSFQRLVQQKPFLFRRRFVYSPFHRFVLSNRFIVHKIPRVLGRRAPLDKL